MTDETYSIRPATADDGPFLREMLYLTIYTEEGRERPSREVLTHPLVARYVVDWGREDDVGFIVADSRTGRPVGAAWYRLFAKDEKGWGYIDDETPELLIALQEEYRGRGIGTELLERLIEAARGKYPALSLNCAPGSRAVRLYRQFGFEPVQTDYPFLVMKKDLKTGR